MSEENIEVIRRAFNAVDRNDLDAMTAALAPDFHYAASAQTIDRAEPGAEGFRRFLEWFWDEFDQPDVEIRSLTDTEDQVLSWVTFRGRGANSGIETTFDLWHVWTFRNGKVVRGLAFRSRAEALEAAGLSE